MSALCQAVLIRLGWVDNDYLSDDQGPILGYARKLQNGDRLERHSQSFNLVRGMKGAGFAGAWLNGAQDPLLRLKQILRTRACALPWK
jgi:hypothetical protein